MSVLIVGGMAVDVEPLSNFKSLYIIASFLIENDLKRTWIFMAYSMHKPSQ